MELLSTLGNNDCGMSNKFRNGKTKKKSKGLYNQNPRSFNFVHVTVLNRKVNKEYFTLNINYTFSNFILANI